MRAVRWAWTIILLMVAAGQFALGQPLAAFVIGGAALVSSELFSEAIHAQAGFRMPVWGAVVASAVIGVIGLGLSHPDTATQSTASASSAPARPAAEAQDPKPLKTTDLELARAYDANEVAAQNKYGGKTLWVKGVVTNVLLDMFDHPAIKMRGQNMFAATQASFDDSAKDSLGRLKKGDLVTMQCTSITEVLSAPLLSDCSLMDNSVR